MPADECIRCGASLKLQDDLELAPVCTQNGEICARCYREMSDEELKAYIK
ncbi:hypothetical protein [Desulfitibacter alkalitolerans]|nr:hypothetical protein [Desulfitibacter alkalitolerans]